MSSNRAYRCTLVAASILLVAIAIIIVFVVLPSIKADPYSEKIPEMAFKAFLINAAIGTLAALLLIVFAFLKPAAGLVRRFVTGLTGLVILFLGFCCTDAAGAYRGDGGPDLDRAVLYLYICAGIYVLSGIMGFVSLFLGKEKKSTGT